MTGQKVQCPLKCIMIVIDKVTKQVFFLIIHPVSSGFLIVLYAKTMIKTPPTMMPDFIRINDGDLSEIELHSVDSINDLHVEHFSKGTVENHCSNNKSILWLLNKWQLSSPLCNKADYQNWHVWDLFYKFKFKLLHISITHNTICGKFVLLFKILCSDCMKLHIFTSTFLSRVRLISDFGVSVKSINIHMTPAHHTRLRSIQLCQVIFSHILSEALTNQVTGQTEPLFNPCCIKEVIDHTRATPPMGTFQKGLLSIILVIQRNPVGGKGSSDTSQLRILDTHVDAWQ